MMPFQRRHSDYIIPKYILYLVLLLSPGLIDSQVSAGTTYSGKTSKKMSNTTNIPDANDISNSTGVVKNTTRGDNATYVSSPGAEFVEGIDRSASSPLVSSGQTLTTGSRRKPTVKPLTSDTLKPRNKTEHYQQTYDVESWLSEKNTTYLSGRDGNMFLGVAVFAALAFAIFLCIKVGSWLYDSDCLCCSTMCTSKRYVLVESGTKVMTKCYECCLKAVENGT
ncbi:uncharacterized protein LOC121376837 [Gigantopelta aegis]|uniref:uncharacterized protein LOC121376837 n=1 Tax=Gigantopelta aegis TaxID=1735272 RepID=UPI001B88AAAE|nr:uncharacterized protein LOC121376837 [Gigantopelta aegis]